MSNLPAFVLVRPQMGENIGAAARAMANFGLDEMRLVAPRDSWPNPAAVAMAAGAGHLLDAATVHPDVSDATADAHFVFATTARMRGLVKPILSPEEAMADARRRSVRGERVAVLFGPERTGLETAEITCANALVTVPVAPEFPSLNLAQCVLLMGYEWRKRGDTGPVSDFDSSPPASAAEVEALARHWEERLDEAGFFFPPQKAQHMKQGLRNLWSRLPLMTGDVQILHGMLRQIVRHRDGDR